MKNRWILRNFCDLRFRRSNKWISEKSMAHHIFYGKPMYFSTVLHSKCNCGCTMHCIIKRCVICKLIKIGKHKTYSTYAMRCINCVYGLAITLFMLLISTKIFNKRRYYLLPNTLHAIEWANASRRKTPHSWKLVHRCVYRPRTYRIYIDSFISINYTSATSESIMTNNERANDM